MQTSTGDFKITDPTLSELLANDLFVFYIPEFQRDYTWTGEFDLLLKDLKYQMDNHPDAYYYLGSVITFKDSLKPHIHQVIDGQQRITSFLLLFAAMRDFLRKHYPNNDDLTRYPWDLIKKARVHGVDERNVPLLETSDEFGQVFLDLIYSGEEINDEIQYSEIHYRTYKAALKFFEDLTKEVKQAEKFKEVEKFIDHILSKVKVAHIVADEFKQAFVMFERMNDRGKPLNTTERFKYLLMSQYSGLGIEAFKSEANNLLINWRRIEDIVAKTRRADSMKQFLLHHLQAWYWTSKVPESETINEARKVFEAQQVDAKQFLLFMEEDAKRYVKFTDAKDLDNQPQVDLQFKRQFISTFTQYLPLLLLISSAGPPKLKKLSDYKGYPKKFDDMCSKIVYMAFVYSFLGMGFNDIESNLPNWIQLIRNNKYEKFEKELVDMLKENKGALENQLLNSDYMKQKHNLRVFLSHIIEKEVRVQFEQEYDYEEVPTEKQIKKSIEKTYEQTEEHIIPKLILKTTGKGAEALKEICPPKVDKDLYKSLVYRPGNLVALWHFDNQDANDDPPSKKFADNVYGGAGKQITSRLIQHASASGSKKQPGPRARHTIVKYHYQPIELENGYFMPNHVYLRDHIIFNVLSDKLGFELKVDQFDKSMCIFCSDKKFSSDSKYVDGKYKEDPYIKAYFNNLKNS